MRMIRSIALLAALLTPTMTLAQTEIHKCTDADGGVMYSQLPCKDEVPEEADSPVESETANLPERPMEAPAILPSETLDDGPETRAARAACKKRYRDEIDAIDAEIRREYSKEKDADYKQRLLSLTRALRAC